MAIADDARERTERLLGRAAVLDLTSLSVPTLYREMAQGTFPRPVRVSRNRVAWREVEVLAWIAERIAERDQSPTRAA